MLAWEAPLGQGQVAILQTEPTPTRSLAGGWQGQPLGHSQPWDKCCLKATSAQPLALKDARLVPPLHWVADLAEAQERHIPAHSEGSKKGPSALKRVEHNLRKASFFAANSAVHGTFEQGCWKAF